MRRVIVIFVCVIALLIAGMAGGGHASGSSVTNTRLRLDLTSTSEWASLTFDGGAILTHYVSSASSNAVVTRGKDVVVLTGAQPASATVDLVLSVPANASPQLILAKSKYGYATAKVIRTNTAPVTVASFSNHKHTNTDCSVSMSVSRSAIVGEGLKIPMLDSRRLVLAFYYPWFEAGEFTKGMWYDTPAGPYQTEDPAEVAAQVNQAGANGIEGFIYSWDGLYDRPQRFDYVLNAAKARGNFYAAPVLELFTWRLASGSYDVSAIVAAAELALNRAQHPAYLRMADGTPVLFVYGSWAMEAATWRAVAAALTAKGHDFFAVGDSIEANYGFDGSYYYNPNNRGAQGLRNRNNGAAIELRLPAQVDPTKKQRLWAATVSPGQNKSYLYPLAPENVARDNGARYDMTWQTALPSNPEWTLVTSWNEWYEATHVAPSQRFGNRALYQTKSWAAYFKDPSSVTAGSGGSTGGSLIPELPLFVGMKSVG